MAQTLRQPSILHMLSACCTPCISLRADLLALFGLFAVLGILSNHPAKTLKKNDENFQQFEIRLKYLDANVGTYITKLQETIRSINPAESEKLKFTATALQTTQNIQALVKAWLKPNPTFNAKAIPLSWSNTLAKRKTVSSTASSSVAPTVSHRHVTENQTPIKKLRGEANLYVPPSRLNGTMTTTTTSATLIRGGRGRGFRGRN